MGCYPIISFNRSGTVKLSEGIFIQSNDTLSLRIENNFIGGTQPSAGGSPMAETNASLALAGITVNISNSSPVASIKGNYIGNYSRSGSGHASFRALWWTVALSMSARTPFATLPLRVPNPSHSKESRTSLTRHPRVSCFLPT